MTSAPTAAGLNETHKVEKRRIVPLPELGLWSDLKSMRWMTVPCKYSHSPYYYLSSRAVPSTLYLSLTPKILPFAHVPFLSDAACVVISSHDAKHVLAASSFKMIMIVLVLWTNWHFLAPHISNPFEPLIFLSYYVPDSDPGRPRYAKGPLVSPSLPNATISYYAA